MPDFNAKQEARKIEEMAKECLHEGRLSFGAEERLVDELRGLTPQQVSAVQVQMRWDNWKPNQLPVMDLIASPDTGNASRISIRASGLDLVLGSNVNFEIEQIELTPDGANVSRRAIEPGAQWMDRHIVREVRDSKPPNTP